MFYVSDIAKEKEFYTTIVGLQLIDDQGQFVSFKVSETDTCRLSLNGMHLEGPFPGHQTVIIETNDVDGFYQQIKENVNIVHPITNEAWGRTFIFKDPDGNKIEILQR